MTVTKVVGFDLRIPKHFSFNFSNFSKIFYGIYKFAVFEKKKGNELLHLGPWISVSSQGRSLADGTAQRRVGRLDFRCFCSPTAREMWGKR